MSLIPKISFKVYRHQSAPDWLIKKGCTLEMKWNHKKDGEKLIKKIMRTCNLTFPQYVLDDGIDVVLKKYSRKKHGNIVGSILPTKPTRIQIFVKKKDRYPTLKSTLCHELIHSLMWAKYYGDKRRRAISLFGDLFADELLTTMLEELIMKRKMNDVDFEYAFDYAREETYIQLKNLKRTKRYNELLEELKAYLKEYKKAIREGKDALKERKRILQDISSPLPLVLDE